MLMENNINYLATFQEKLKAPKGQFNSFGRYKYRSCEDIIEAVKPIINPEGFHLILSDDVVVIGNRIYIKATATLSNGKDIHYESVAFAREEQEKKGMDASQITGTASSYARKYALNGLFAIDDTKDSDATNTHDSMVKGGDPDSDGRPWLSDAEFKSVVARIQQNDLRGLASVQELADKVYKNYKMKNEYKKAIEEAVLSKLN